MDEENVKVEYVKVVGGDQIVVKITSDMSQIDLDNTRVGQSSSK